MLPAEIRLDESSPYDAENREKITPRPVSPLSKGRGMETNCMRGQLEWLKALGSLPRIDFMLKLFTEYRIAGSLLS